METKNRTFALRSPDLLLDLKLPACFNRFLHQQLFANMTTQSAAPGERDLATLLSTLELTMSPETFVFVTLPGSKFPPSSLQIQMSFREAEGTTIITTKDSADAHGIEYTFPCKMITLNVHSSLEAVGFMAVISAKLTEKGIGANPVSGYYHDHCFVPLGKENDAMKVLQDLATEARKQIET
jgi:uncharacterized protein